VYDVRVCGTVKLWPSLVTWYEKPDLSVDASQASVTALWLRLVTRRFVGVVGGVRSLDAAATEPTTTNARTTASAAPAVRRTTAFFAVMSFLP
jgi:hypothetical protein